VTGSSSLDLSTPQLLDSSTPQLLNFSTSRLLDFSTGVLMTVPGRRAERLADQIRAEVAEMISGELKDPRIGFATVTAVDMSGDLHYARVSVSVLGNADAQQKSLEGLTSAASYVRHELAQRLRLRRVPELTFVLDPAAKENEKLETLLEKLKKEP
jgi:ribosome-binding factor A